MPACKISWSTFISANSGASWRISDLLCTRIFKYHNISIRKCVVWSYDIMYVLILVPQKIARGMGLHWHDASGKNINSRRPSHDYDYYQSSVYLGALFIAYLEHGVYETLATIRSPPKAYLIAE